MSISSRQVTKEMNRIIGDKMKEGYIPTVEYISSQIGLFYATNKVGSPFFRARHMPYRKLFDVDSYNNNMHEIKQDLDNLYEELISQFTVVLTDFDYFDTERRAIMHRVLSLEGSLSDLFLSAANTEGYVYSVHDGFIDRSKIDLKHSTCEINTDSGMVTIRESISGITKVDMSHYFQTVNFPILASSEYAKTILSNTLFPSSKFGYAFSDVNASWAQDIVTSSPGKLEVSFIVDISPGNEDGVAITRIECMGQSSKNMFVQPLYSIDNVNFVVLPMGSGLGDKLVTDGKTTTWNFDITKVKYIKFVVTKDIEDEHIAWTNAVPAYRYVVGFKRISMFKMGYDVSSTLYSLPHVVTDESGEPLTISKASLVVDQDLQTATSATYFLSLGSNVSDDPTTFNWAPVSPVNEEVPTEQQVVDFKQVAFFNNIPEITWDESSYGLALETSYGISFYKIYEFPYEPVSGSVSLYRGKSNWQVTPTYDIRRVAVFDEQHSFGTGNSVTLNNPDFTPVAGNGLIRGSVRVKSDPGQSPSYWATTPGDFTVNYTTFAITRSTGSVIVADPASAANTVYVDYQFDAEDVKPTMYTTYVYIMNPAGIDINHIPFTQAEIDGGQFTKITTTDGEVNFSTFNKIHLSPGWHRVITTSEPETIYDRFYSVNNSKYLQDLVYIQYAYADKLQEVSWFDLKNNTFKLDHSKYAIIDYDGDGRKEIIVNYRPQVNPWGSVHDDMLCPSGAETYVLSYKFITAETNKIYLKAVLSRSTGATPTATPTLRSYTIKIGY